MNRDYYFDNLKTALIALVVFGHFVEPYRKDLYEAAFLNIFIYVFHMPLFVFVSGYFSRTHSFLNICKKILLPYLVFQVIYYLIFKHYMGQEKYKLQFLNPAWTLWYLLSLFTWKIWMPQLKELKLIPLLVISLIVGIFVGYEKRIGHFMGLSRSFVFFPFFLIGYYFDKERFLEKFYKPHLRWIAFATFVTIGFTIYLFTKEIDPYLFYGNHSFYKLKITRYGGLYRLSAYALTFLIGFIFLFLIPNKKTFFSWIGLRTLNVYLLHGLVFRILQKSGYFKGEHDLLALSMTTAISILLTIILAMTWTDFILKPISSIPLKKIFKDERFS